MRSASTRRHAPAGRPKNHRGCAGYLVLSVAATSRSRIYRSTCSSRNRSGVVCIGVGGKSVAQAQRCCPWATLLARYVRAHRTANATREDSTVSFFNQRDNNQEPQAPPAPEVEIQGQQAILKDPNRGGEKRV